MTLLELVTEFTRRQGLPVPSSVVNATDDTTLQIYGLANEGIQDVADRYFWQQLIQRISFVHANGADYAALDFSTVYTDFKAIVDKTFWDTSSRLPVVGPLNATEWEFTITMTAAPARSCYRLYGNKLRIYPVDTSLTYALEYFSKFGVYDVSGATAAEYYTADEDYPLLPSAIMLADLKWRYRREKGQPYAEDQRTCEEMIANWFGREPHPALDIGYRDDTQLVGPGLLVAAGSWTP